MYIAQDRVLSVNVTQHHHSNTVFLQHKNHGHLVCVFSTKDQLHSNWTKMENVVRKLFMENSLHGDVHGCRARVTKYDNDILLQQLSQDVKYSSVFEEKVICYQL